MTYEIRVTLSSPEDNSDTTDTPTFTCDTTDDGGLANVTLYIWNSTGIYYTNTTDISGTENSTSWNASKSWNQCISSSISSLSKS